MSASGDQFKDLMETLGMVLVDAGEEPERYSVEPHGDCHAVYFGRNMARHGFNLGHLTECATDLPKKIEDGLNLLHDATKGKSAGSVRLVQVGWYSQQHGECKFLSLYDSPEEPDDPAYRWQAAMVVRVDEVCHAK
ncbi:hypothetical protein [Cupriavidus campinensis]|uniref:Uncharacterized protein n=1 Tax=Cupriavidus campinensis TaxID=151783 RepID=A0ABY3EST1_9BURK|nr:hypothetical protein [Cupriavidus campinensis]TSP14035.1 hypothetical protein FGG12_06075 [Cupriavidus campinensis]